MALVIVERAFDAPQAFEELQSKETQAAWCLETHRVRFLRTFFALDRRHMVCLYDAPDAESVRTTQRTAGLPVTHAYSATPVVDRILDAPKGYSLVVAQRALPPGITIEMVRHLATDPTGCGKRLRLEHFGAFLSLDCTRMCCAYYAPDLESVRVANREAEIPIEWIWRGELIPAAPASLT